MLLRVIVATAFGLFLMGYLVQSRTIPSYIPLCKRHDPDLSKCIVKTINALRPYLLKGIPEFDIPSLDPYPMPDVFTQTGTGSNLDFQVHLSGLLYGCKDYDLKDLQLDLGEEYVNVSLEVYFPVVRLEGPYNLKGKLLMFDIDASGNLNNSFFEVTMIAQTSGNITKKGSKEYLNFNNMHLEMSANGQNFNLGNLFENNEELTQAANQLFNDNIDVAREELFPIFNKMFETIAKTAINRVFHLFSLQDLFLEK